MASLMYNFQYLIAVLVFVAKVHMLPDCNLPDRVYVAPPFEEKLFYSDSVAYGIVRELYMGGYRYDTMYTVKLEVYCTFKGDPLPQFINITKAGYGADECSAKEFKDGEVYFVFLDNDGFYPTYYPDAVRHEYEVADIPLYCGVEINYPIGIDEETSKTMCPEVYAYYDGCVDFRPTEAPTTTFVTETTESPKVPESSGCRWLMSVWTTILCLVMFVLL